MDIKSITVKKVYGKNVKITIPFHHQITILVSSNGYYKTTALKTIVNVCTGRGYDVGDIHWYDEYGTKHTIDTCGHPYYVSVFTSPSDPLMINGFKIHTKKFLSMIKKYLTRDVSVIFKDDKYIIIRDGKEIENVPFYETQILNLFASACWVTEKKKILLLDLPEAGLDVNKQKTIIIDLLSCPGVDKIVVATQSPFIYEKSDNNWIVYSMGELVTENKI